MTSGNPLAFPFLNKIGCCIIAVCIFCSAAAIAQPAIEGKVLEDNNAPVPFATIKLLERSSGIVSDATGYFSLPARGLKQNDTLLITSVGYETLKIPARSALQIHAFILKPYSKKMETVIVRSFGKEDVAGAKSETVGYYRSWSTNKTGGEIGRPIIVPHKEYQLSKVRFKIYSSCDTCTIRLHIREFTDGRPGAEILRDSVAQTIKKAAVADKAYEFDLGKYNIILAKQHIFVSFEVLKGTRTDSTACSLSFVGSEPGSYQYKTRMSDGWTTTEDYAIFMKVFFKYD